MFIDKTDVINKGIAAFPSLFIEGAAACGKTTAVNMFLEAHPEMPSDVFYMDQERDVNTFSQRIGQILADEAGGRFFVFENMTSELAPEVYKVMADLVRALSNVQSKPSKVIFVSREKPPAELLSLLWQGKMGMVYPQNLMFTQAETDQLVRQHGLRIPLGELHQATGGWPGCVMVLLHMAKQLGGDSVELEKLLGRYEIRSFIEREILSRLSEAEQAVVDLAGKLPWLTAEMVDIDEALDGSLDGETLENLQRKGMLVYNEGKKHWSLHPLFREKKPSLIYEQGLQFGQWYEERGFAVEATLCYSYGKCGDAFRRCVIEHYSQMPFELLAGSNIFAWSGGGSELCWLRGMCAYLNQDMAGFRKELQKVQRMKGEVAAEVHLNLAFADPEVSMEEWLELLEEKGPECGQVRLYHLAENSHVLLGGVRELSTLFQCSVREEKRRMKLLREWLGDAEWLCIQLARVEFDLEIQTKGLQESETWDAVLELVSDEAGSYSWRCKVACLYLLNQMHITYGEPEVEELLQRLKKQLQWEENPLCQRHLAAVGRIHDLWGAGEAETTRWLRDAAPERALDVNEENYYLLFQQARGYLQLHQYDHAGRILSQLIPYVQQYHRSRLLAEMLFQQAIVDLAKGQKGAALRNTVASFLYTGDAHYVLFYVSYGHMGHRVLEAYVEWLRNAEPKKWQRKKHYNYRNVMKMPREDYLELVLRLAKRSAKGNTAGSICIGDDKDVAVETGTDFLTMTETLVLQNLNKGLSNKEICAEMNLKLPTVKTHISSIYKKLGVGSRVQAVLKGKEMGILK